MSANGETDSGQLTQLAELLPLSDSKRVRETYNRIKPDIDMRFEFTCESCSHAGEVTMPLTAEFFWPNS